MAKPDLEKLPLREDYGSGRYRRCIALDAAGDTVRGELADDFHHFGVSLRHQGGRVVEVCGEDVRVPWTTCPGALVPLRRMEGAHLSRSVRDLLRHTSAREQCTHLHDLACLAIAHAARVLEGGAVARRYDAEVPDRVGDETRSVLQRDGAAVLAWQVRGLEVAASEPAIAAPLPLRGTAFHRFLASRADPDFAEAAWVLQRACFIAMGRRHDFERIERAQTFAPVVGAACHTFDPARVEGARRVHGTVRDFSDGADGILSRAGNGG